MLRLPVLLLLLACLAPTRETPAQVRHCVAADGTRLYTDRRCADLGASDDLRLPASAPAPASRLRTVCARSVQALAYALDDAIRSGDANRIAGLYDWAGMGTANASQVMSRLQEIAAREVVGVREVRRGERRSADAGTYLPSAPDGPPIGLRVEQVQANGHTPAHASFGLRHRMGCWWVRL